MKWNDMKSAPMDGSLVLLRSAGGSVTVGRWTEHRAYKHCWAWMAEPIPEGDFLFAFTPTAWCEIPEYTTKDQDQ